MSRAETPARIAALALPPSDARIGLIACPGGREAQSGTTLDDDLAALVAWGAEGLITLLEHEEFVALRVEALGERAAAAGLWWRHLPIQDMCAPDERFERGWAIEGPFVRERLSAGARVVLHCWAGLGRTGTVAARLLMEFGAEPDVAVRAVRRVRPGAIQTLAQENYLREFAARGA